MAQNILKLFLERGFLLDKEMLDFLSELKDEEIANEIINKIAIISKQKLITKNLVNQNIDKLRPIFFDLDSEKKKLIEKFFINVSISVEVHKETFYEANTSDNLEAKNPPVKIISSPIISSKKIEVKDFVRHFRNRFVFLKGLIQQKTELENLTSIDKIGKNHRNFSIIGIVTSKSITKNKNIILEVEDLTDRIKLLINQSKEEIFEKAKEILLDDVIGFKCSGSKEFLFVNDIFYPDCFLKEKHKSEKETYAVFTSDIHIGSVNFLQRNFEKFIGWLNGEDCNPAQKELLKKIKYLFIVGDSVDGVGIYPGQEKFLTIKDMKKQYDVLAEYLKKVPSHISIILCPGQHDGVRVAEPQPPIGEDFGEALHKIPNLFLVSNPSMVEIEGGEGRQGIRVLMYHGASMHPIINEIEELRLINAHQYPARVVKHLLLRRHLAPTHGEMVYIPDENEDSMLIKEIPDVVATGDLHKPDIDKYNGTLIIASSCWQSITPFEEKVGNKPDPGKVPVLNLQTGAIKIIDFSDVDEDLEGDKIKEIENNDSNNILYEVKKDAGQ
ncbi:DNA polymerase II small subunit [uncultured archaeon]|nr:DNA polymerase II small subunit [uncultured archaeon]